MEVIMRYLLACVICFGVCFAQDEVVIVEEPTTVAPVEVTDAGSN